MNASSPITIDGHNYDKYSINLCITGRYNELGQSDANIALRLVPTRAGDGELLLAEPAAIGLLRGSFSEITDPAEQTAVTAIQNALQTYITTKGL